MMFQTESKMQAWRALAIFQDRAECLIYVGCSTSRVREGYGEAFLEILEEDERALVVRVELQCWQGAADQGHWIQKGTLPIPTPKPLTTLADMGPRLLPFRKPAAQPVPVPATTETTATPILRPLGEEAGDDGVIY